MWDITKESFCNLLLKYKGMYTLSRAAQIYGQLSDADGDIQSAALRWMTRGEKPSLSAGEWSVDKLEKKFDMNVLAAILTVNWLRKEPHAALAAIKDGIQ